MSEASEGRRGEAKERTLMRLTLCSAQRASMSLMYSAVRRVRGGRRRQQQPMRASRMAKTRKTKSGLTLSAGLDENAKVSDTLVERLGALSESSGESVVDEGVLEAGAGEARHEGERREGKKAKVKMTKKESVNPLVDLRKEKQGHSRQTRCEKSETDLENLLESLLNGGGTSGGGCLSNLNLLNGVNGLGSSVS